MDTLEQLMADGRIIGYEVYREPGKVTVGVTWVEFDADDPRGYEVCGHGAGPTLGEAITQATRNLRKAERKAA